MSGNRSWERRSAADILSNFRIRLKSTAPGRYYTTCPECSHARKKSHQPCLGVTITLEGVTFGCNHCDWTGGGYYESARRLAPSPAMVRPVCAAVKDDAAERSAFAVRIWNEAKDPRGSLVAQYLASRGLELPDDLAGTVIRFHPALKFDGGYLGGMLALFRDIGTDEPCGIHRTFLDSAGRKVHRKMLGRAGGAAIKLDPDATVALGLHIGEGAETCLAARLAGFRPVWALGSANAITSFPVLAGIEAITILGEVDDGGANDRAARDCSARWIKAAREAFTVKPLIGGDLNDVWREVA
jgi:hypothetical protein